LHLEPTKVTLNHIIWLRSLAEEEVGPSNRVVEDIKTNELSDGLKISLYEVATIDELTEFMAWLEDACRSGLRPILHIDCHADSKSGLRLDPSGDFCDWPTLADFLRASNAASLNNLCCVTNACFGAFIGTQFEISKIAPSFVLIGAPSEVSNAQLEENFASFYKDLHQTFDIKTAWQRHLQEFALFWDSHNLYFEMICGYVISECSGKMRRLRTERVLTAVQNNLSPKDRTQEQIKESRRIIKQGLMPGQSVIDKYSDVFLAGRPVSFTWKHVEIGVRIRRQKNRRNNRRL
jgi:hypothetical protein